MSKIIIIRDGEKSEPYSLEQITELLKNNQVKLNDWAQVEGEENKASLVQVFKKCGWSIPPACGVWKGLAHLGWDFVLPWAELQSLNWARDLRFIYLSLIGLLPLGIVMFLKGSITYVSIAAYFSALWGLFFLFLYKTEHVKIATCIFCFLVTAFVSITALLILLQLGIFEVATKLSQSAAILWQLVGWFFLAGLPEELCKAAVIFYLVRRPGQNCVPQAIVVYGMFSGLGFGIHEGVLYQMNANRGLDLDLAYFHNILRLTSLPFLHASWCGIAAYFIALAARYPHYRKSLWVVGIMIPAIIHAVYDTFSQSGLIPALFGVVLLTIYLASNKTIDAPGNTNQ